MILVLMTAALAAQEVAPAEQQPAQPASETVPADLQGQQTEAVPSQPQPSRTSPADPAPQQAAAEPAEATQQTCMGGGGIMSFVPMLAIIAIFYFLMIRPQQKQAKMLRAMRDAFQKDDRVITSGGIHGVITNLKGDVVTVRIADNVKIDVDRNSLTLDSVEREPGK